VNYEIRDLERATDIAPLEDVQLAAWGFSEREVVPGSMMVVHAHSGGIVAGAYPEGEDVPVGFVYGFPAVREGVLLHHSHMLAVVPAHRGSGLAVALKLHQRGRAAAQGHEQMTWTMDPLLARNARLNLGKLGARVIAYLPDWYATRTGIYAGLPADRLLIGWDLTAGFAARPLERPVGERVLEARDGKVLSGPLPVRSGTDAEQVLIEVPRDIAAVKERDIAAALAWRLGQRQAFGEYLGRGYVGTDLAADGERTFYVLRQG
jgi:predicted GNAT superfamily acetyltransferase